MKSAWKLTQGLDWEQPLFYSKICELLRYYAEEATSSEVERTPPQIAASGSAACI